ncbi:MAG: tyrosine-type recombinase/integrase [Rhodothermales bacterium]
MRELIGSINIATISGLRDRALIGVMLYTFARVSAVINMTIGDYSSVGKRSELRLLEKGGKYIVMPAHHNLQLWLDDYIDVAGDIENTAIPLFCTINSKRELTTRAMNRNDALRMIKRRAKKAGIPPRTVCSHSMRGTGITTFLENDGSLEQAQYMAGHSDPRTTRLYDRRQQKVTQDEVERIAFW